MVSLSKSDPVLLRPEETLEADFQRSVKKNVIRDSKGISSNVFVVESSSQNGENCATLPVRSKTTQLDPATQAGVFVCVKFHTTVNIVKIMGCLHDEPSSGRRHDKSNFGIGSINIGVPGVL